MNELEKLAIKEINELVSGIDAFPVYSKLSNALQVLVNAKKISEEDKEALLKIYKEAMHPIIHTPLNKAKSWLKGLDIK